MRELEKEELSHVYGGISASLIGYLIRGGSFIIDAGRALGSSLRRYFSHNMCGF